METITDDTINSIWNIDDAGWLNIPTKGPAGGILIVSRKEIVEIRDFFIGEVMLSCLFTNITNQKVWFFSGVYCKGNVAE